MTQLVSLIRIRWIVIYPMDSAIQRLNNRGQILKSMFKHCFLLIISGNLSLLLSIIRTATIN